MKYFPDFDITVCQVGTAISENYTTGAKCVNGKEMQPNYCYAVMFWSRRGVYCC